MPSTLLLVLGWLSVASVQAGAPATATAMTLDVDATDAPMKILHATMSMAAKAGPATLFYPKWIPGEHMPSGPVANLTGLHIFADGKEIDWRRGGAFGSTAPANAKIAVIN
jgi:hypothetical protein